MDLVQMGTISGGLAIGFIAVGVIVVVVMLGFFATRWNQHRREARAGQLPTRRPNPKDEHRR
jgi:hypothetical protein